MKPNRFAASALAAALCIPAAALAAEEHVGRDAEKGDPARWYEPADTPQKRYETAVKEARAALDAALKECRIESADRAACEADARENHRHDLDEARSLRDETPGARR